MNKIIEQDMQEILSAPLPWEEFSGANILISGGSGFLPAYMVETLMWLNREVLRQPCCAILLVRDRNRAMDRFSHCLAQLAIWERDASWPMAKRIHVDYVIHAASQASPKFYGQDPAGTILPNAIGTYHLLELARDQARSFLFFSSGDAAFPLDPLDPRSCYGESKRMGETMCAAWARQFQVPAKIARISHTYGPGMRMDDGRVFADFTRDILNGGPIVMNSDGSARRCFCYLADATKAFFTVLLKGEVATAYNVANPYAAVTIGQLARRLGMEFGIPVEYRVKPSLQAMEGPMPNIDLLKALGWNPTIGIEEGFRRTVASYAK